MYLGEIPTPTLQKEQVLIQVEGAALNRADILQRQGHYPPPAGESEILGLEVAGKVVKTSPGAEALQGERVMALLSGGGYAEYVAVHKSLVLKIPENLTTLEAAGIMEAFLTGWQALSWIVKLQPNESVLIHAGASGVGSAAIQLAKLIGAEVFTTASAAKLDFCSSIGADYCVDYGNQNFSKVVKENTPSGVNAIIDFIGASYFQQNLDSLTSDGRMVMLGLLGGVRPDNINLASILFKRLTISGSTLRSRSLDYRGRLVTDFKDHCYHYLETGKLNPIIDRVFSWDAVMEAHQFMEANKNLGKVILAIK